MRYYTVLSLLGLCASSAQAASSTTTKTASYSYSSHNAKDTAWVGYGTLEARSTSLYGGISCTDKAFYTTSSNYFQCAADKSDSQFPTSCGGGAKPTMYYPNKVTNACNDKGAQCQTQILFDDKSHKHAVTGYFCDTKKLKPTYTLYRSNPPELINGKESGAAGFGADFATVGALFAGFFMLGMAIMI